MDIPTWHQLSQQDGKKAAEHWQSVQSRLSPEQRRAVWAWSRPLNELAFASTAATPLAGVPFAAKDLFHYPGVPTMAGGRIARPRSRRTSRLITKLESLGAVLTGKTHLHEFAYGLTGENPHYGDVEHPHHVGRGAGGSSSGSAAAVAAGVVPFALGTDTAGSLRVPASYCGLFSWRGQPGEAWIADSFPLAPSFDTAGWLCTTAADCHTLWRLVYSPGPVPPSEITGAYLPASALGIPPSPPSANALAAAAAALATETLDSRHPFVQAVQGVAETYSILQSTEAYAVHQADLDRHRSEYGRAVWERIDRGRNWTANQMDRARHHALRIRSAYSAYFENHDFLVTPVTLQPAPRHSDESPQLREQLLNLNTHVSLAGRPAISFPVAVDGGLTLGLQVVFSTASSPAVTAVLERLESC